MDERDLSVAVFDFYPTHWSSRRLLRPLIDMYINVGIAVDSMETTAYTCYWNNNDRVM